MRDLPAMLRILGIAKRPLGMNKEETKSHIHFRYAGVQHWLYRDIQKQNEH